MRRAVALGVVLGLFAVVFPWAGTAVACSCVPDRVPARDAGVAFVGVPVTQRQEPGEFGSAIYRFEVSLVGRGSVERVQEVDAGPAGNGGLCGVTFELNQRYAVYAERREDGIIATGTCEFPRILTPPSIEAPAVTRGPSWFLRGTQDTGNADLTFGFGNPGDVSLMGDWDGDGTRTPGVQRGNTWFLRDEAGVPSATTAFVYGDVGDVPVVGDWDGDGIDTIGVVRSGIWYLRASNSTGGADAGAFAYGDPGDIPIAGNWDADLADEVGVVRTEGTQLVWHLSNDLAAGFADTSFRYGDVGDGAVVGDWDGNRSDTPGVHRGGVWFLRNSNDEGFGQITLRYGDPGDRPLSWG